MEKNLIIDPVSKQIYLFDVEKLQYQKTLKGFAIQDTIYKNIVIFIPYNSIRRRIFKLYGINNEKHTAINSFKDIL